MAELIHDIEKTSLDAHVTICSERYRRLEDKFDVLEVRLEKLTNDVGKMQEKQSANMEELKQLIQKSSDSRFRAVVAAAGTIVAALISALAYVIARLPIH